MIKINDGGRGLLDIHAIQSRLGHRVFNGKRVQPTLSTNTVVAGGHMTHDAVTATSTNYGERP